eukprot:Amastigsp_a698_187.p2 type:complete len:172 gc:universal Amastigsp_a698_187:868-353(-)
MVRVRVRRRHQRRRREVRRLENREVRERARLGVRIELVEELKVADHRRVAVLAEKERRGEVRVVVAPSAAARLDHLEHGRLRVARREIGSVVRAGAVRSAAEDVHAVDLSRPRHRRKHLVDDRVLRRKRLEHRQRRRVEALHHTRALTCAHFLEIGNKAVHKSVNTGRLRV